MVLCRFLKLFRTKSPRPAGRPRHRPAVFKLEDRTAPVVGLSWGFEFGAGSIDEAQAVRTDPAGNVYVAGVFRGAVDFDPSAGVTPLTSTAIGTSNFIAKYTAAGQLLWVQQMGDSGRVA